MDGDQARHSGGAQQQGNFVPTDTAIAATILGFNAATRQINLYVEGIEVSEEAGDARVEVEVDPDGDGPQGFFAVDAVRFTVLSIDLFELPDGDGNPTKSASIKESAPCPTFTNVTASFSNVHPSADGASLLADLTVAGRIHSQICDLTDGPLGTITNVLIYVNGGTVDGNLNGLPVEVNKGADATSWRHPYPFEGTFNHTIEDVEVGLGNNDVVLAATEWAMGRTGTCELTNEITATLDYAEYVTAGVQLDYSMLRATLDFTTNITSLGQLTPTNPVALFFEVVTNNIAIPITNSPVFAGQLYPYTNLPAGSPLVLTNPQAWVVISNTTALEYFLRTDIRGNGLEVLVSVPHLAPPHILFRLKETGADTSAFSFDHIALEMSFATKPETNVADTATVRLMRTGQSWSTNLLTETGTNSGVFQAASPLLELRMGWMPSCDPGTNDFAEVYVTSGSLSVTNYRLETWESESNSLAFATLDELQTVWEKDIGAFWGATYEAGECGIHDQSEGGEVTLHFYLLDGPSEVIAILAAQSNGRIVQGPDGEYYIGNVRGRPAPLIGVPAPPPEDDPGCEGSFSQGFEDGFSRGAKALFVDPVAGIIDSVSSTNNVFYQGALTFFDMTHGNITSAEAVARLAKHTPLPMVKRFTGRFSSYVIEQLENNGGQLDFEMIWDGYGEAAYEILPGFLKKTPDEYQQALLTIGGILKEVHKDLTSECDYTRGRIMGRTTFELLTIYLSEVKLIRAAQATSDMQFLINRGMVIPP